MNKFAAIENRINDLKEITSNSDAIQKLHAQLIEASNSKNSVDDLSEILKQDCDVAEQFDVESYEFREIREIQDAIICTFAE